MVDVVPINRSKVFADDDESASEAVQRFGVTAYMPVKATSTTEMTLLHSSLDGTACLMKRLMEEMPAANRGKDRYCLNTFSTPLVDPASYEPFANVCSRAGLPCTSCSKCFLVAATTPVSETMSSYGHLAATRPRSGIKIGTWQAIASASRFWPTTSETMMLICSSPWTIMWSNAQVRREWL